MAAAATSRYRVTVLVHAPIEQLRNRFGHAGGERSEWRCLDAGPSTRVSIDLTAPSALAAEQTVVDRLGAVIPVPMEVVVSVPL